MWCAWTLLGAVAWAAGGWLSEVRPDGEAWVIHRDDDGPVDVRLRRVNPAGGAEIKSAEAIACPEPWQTTWRAQAGDTLTLSLPRALPPGAWAVATRRAGTNDAWERRGEAWWIAGAQVEAVQPCGATASLRIDTQPILAAAREAGRLATVRVGDDALGLVVGARGQVLAPAGGRAEEDVRFAPGALAPDERTLRYRRVGAVGLPAGVELLEPVEAGAFEAALPRVAALIVGDDGLRVEHRGVWHGVRASDGALVPVRPETVPGAAIAEGPPAWRGALPPGSPLMDHAGRVWGMVAAGGQGVWLVRAAEALGPAPAMAARLVDAAAVGPRVPLVDPSAEALRAISVVAALAGADRRTMDGGLAELRAVLAVSGWRGQLVTRALERTGVEAVVAALPARSRRQRAEVAEVSSVVRARLGRDTPATPAVVRRSNGTLRREELGWVSVEGRGWLTASVQPADELEVWLEGCDAAELQVFDPAGVAVTAPRWVDDFSPRGLPVPGDLAELAVRVDAGPACAGPFRVALVAREAAPALGRGTTAEAPAVATGPGMWRVAPRAGETTWLQVPLEGGAVYEVRTAGLQGSTDTVLTVRLPDGRAWTNDDGGGGLASRLRIDNVLPTTAVVSVELPTADIDTSFTLAVERVFKFGVTEPIVAGRPPAELPGSAWSGFAMPVSLDGEDGELTVQAVRGNVYAIQTALDVSMVGGKGAAALRLLRDEEPTSWSVRPFRVFLALETGPHTLTLREPAEGGREDPWFVQIVDRPAQPEPRPIDLGERWSDAYELRPSSRERWDGGVVATMAPGAVGWVRFEATAGVGYVVRADGEAPAGDVTLRAWSGGVEGRPAWVDQRGGPLASVGAEAAATETWWVEVRQGGEAADRVRVSVVADVPYDGLRRGDQVRLGRHTPVEGGANWTPEMDVYVGRNAVLTELVGQDEWGAWVVRVDLDRGQFVWRTRDMVLTRRAVGL